jgi:hypothetical protein
MSSWHFRDDLRIRRIWNLPRALVPTSDNDEHVTSFVNNSSSTSTNEYNDIQSREFFRELDQRLVSPSTNKPAVNIDDDFDRINELDAVIDQDDLSTIFHDAVDHFDLNHHSFEMINPSLNIAQITIRSHE